MLFDLIYRRYKDKFYDKLVEQFVGQIPDAVSEPVLDFLVDKKVLFEKFLSIQAYHIQKARLQSKKSPEFYDGALMIIRAFLVAVNKKAVQRDIVLNTAANAADSIKKELDSVKAFEDATKPKI